MAKSPTVSEQLILGGTQLVQAEGLTDLSVRRLAEASGRSTMCVYTAFGNRRNLIAAIYRRSAEEFIAELDGLDDPLPALAGHYRSYARDRPRLFHFLFEADLAELGPTGNQERIKLIDAVIAQLDRRGQDGTDYWSRLHGLVVFESLSDRVKSNDQADRAERVHSLLDALTGSSIATK